MSIRLDQITEDDVGNSRQKKKSKITKKEVSVANRLCSQISLDL